MSYPQTEPWDGGPADDHPLLGPKPRMPAACGALGSFNRERVLRLAALITPQMRIVHEDEDAIVLLDRDPRRWGSERESELRGLAWPGSLAPTSKPSGWTGAGRDWNASGIQLEPGRPMLHTSASGISPVYVQSEAEASYFATAIDPLARSSDNLLNVDWQAWASIFTLGFPIGGRTPFEQIKHLGPWQTVAHRRGGRAEFESPAWPWAEIEPTLTAEQGAEAVTEALKSVFARLEGAELIAPISAGRDSRLLSWLASHCGASSLQAFTVYEDTGTMKAADLAADAARSMGLKHTVIRPKPEDFWADARRLQLRSDFQFPTPPWLGAPLVRTIGGIPGITLDGIGGNALFDPTARSVLPEVITAPGRRWRALLWQKMRTRALRAAFRQDEARAIGAAARDQFLAACDPFTEHPARAALAFYLTRTSRAIAMRPSSHLGRSCDVVSPLIEWKVAEALLAVRPEEKFDKRLYGLVFEALESGLGELPFSSEGAGGTFDEVPRRRISEPALRGYREITGSGPLRGQLSGRLRGWLSRDDPVPEGGRQSMNGLEKPVTFHLWHRRYSERLRPFTVAEGFGTPGRAVEGSKGGRRG